MANNFLQSIDSAAAAIFLPQSGKAGSVQSFIATTAGRLLIAAVLAFIIVVVASFFRGPLTSTRIVAGTLPNGLVYSLPRTALDVTVALVVDKCDLVAVPKEGGGFKFVLQLATRQSITIKPVVLADTDYTYLIDLDAVSHPFLPDDLRLKVSDFGLIEEFGHSSPALLTQAKEIASIISDGLELPFSGRTAGDPTPPAPLKADACKGLPTVETDDDEDAPPVTPVGTDTGVSDIKQEEINAPDKPRVYRLQAVLYANHSKALIPDFTDLSTDAKGLLTQKSFEVIFGTPPKGDPQTLVPMPSATGILYRYPQNVELIACLGLCYFEGVLQPGNIYIAASLPVLDRGQEAVIPIRRGLLGNRTIDLAFGGQGGLKSAAINRSATEGEAAPSEDTIETDTTSTPKDLSGDENANKDQTVPIGATGIQDNPTESEK